MPEPPDFDAIYLGRIAALTADQTAAAARARLSRRLFFAAGTLTALCLLVALRGSLPARLSLLPLAAGLIALPFYLNLRSRLERLTRLLAHNRRALDRSSGRQPQSGHTGDELELAHQPHLYRQDLQIFGPDSLFGLLATTRTRLGREALARRLLYPPGNPGESSARQAAIRELAPQFGLREAIALLGPQPTDEIPASQIKEWLAQSPADIPRSTRPLLVLTSSLAAAALLAGIFHLASWPLVRLNLAAILSLQAAMALRARSRVTPILTAARNLPRQVALLTEGLALITASQVEAPILRALRERIEDAAPALSRLNRTLALLEQRNNQYFFLPSLFLALGTHGAIALDRWRSQHARDLHQYLEQFAEFEALNALATYAFEHPENTYPEILPNESPATFEATSLTHPLLPRSSAIPNTIRLDPAIRFYLISGSNMAGKSTLLRAIGTATVLALAGAPIPAEACRLSAFTLCASISVSDSLADGKSKFLAEVERLHAILQAAKLPSSTNLVISTEGEAAASPTQPLPTPSSFAAGGGPASSTHALPPVLFLIDEIFSGTNSADRLTAASAVLRQLVAAGAIGALSTHDLALTTLAQAPADSAPAGLRGRNVHMASPDPDDPLAFDYILKPGINPSTNALAILRLIGIEP